MPYVNIKITEEGDQFGTEGRIDRRGDGSFAARAEQESGHHGGSD